MWEYMESNPSVLMKSNKDGIQRVKDENGGYAFFMESTTIEYWTERECSLSQVGDLLDSKGYGIALRRGSKYTKLFNSALIKLQENGRLHYLKVKQQIWDRQEEFIMLFCRSNGGGKKGVANVMVW